MKISYLIGSFILNAATTLLVLTGCMSGPGFLKQDNASVLKNKESTVDIPMQTNADGSLSATLSSNSAGSQSVQAPTGSAIAGSQITFQPGALAVDTTITMDEGSSLASASVAAELGLDSGTNVSQASSALVITSSAAIDASQPFTISLVLDNGAGLNLTDDSLELVVIYKVVKVESGSQTFVGIIPNKELAVVDGKLIFKTRFFGSYQAAYIPVAAVSKVVEKVATKPIETKREAVAEVVAEQPKTTTQQNSTSGSIDPKHFSVEERTATTMRLRWEQSAPVKQFIVAYAPMPVTTVANSADQVSTAIDVKEQCSGGTQVKLNPSDGINFHTLTNLTPFTPYALRVCAVGFSDEISTGQAMTFSTLDTPPVRPVSFSAIALSSRTLRLSWDPGATIPSGYVLVYRQGTDGQSEAAVTPPADCSDALNKVYLGNSFVAGGGGLFSTELNQFKGNSPVAMTICSVNRDDTLSAGISFKTTTEQFAIACDSGTLDTTCSVSTSKQPDPGKVISGLGNLVIESTGTILAPTYNANVQRSGSLEIDMAGYVELKTFSVNIGKIDASGQGHRLTVGAVAGLHPSIGGSYGGQGGFDRTFLPLANPQPYGNFRLPLDLGSGGGALFSNGSVTSNGAAGGGRIHIRANALINNGYIFASGENGNGISKPSGGSGGSILIEVNQISTNAASNGGFIKTVGGSTTETSGSGGSGGRIAVYYKGSSSSNITDMKIETYGGTSPESIKNGASGTVFIEKRTDDFIDRELRIGSTISNVPPAPNASARTFVDLTNDSSTSFQLSRLLIDGTARAAVTQHTGFILRNLYITSQATLDHSGLGLPALLTYDSTLAKNADNLGGGGSGGGGAGFGDGGNGGYGYGGTGGVGEEGNMDVTTAPIKRGGAGGIGWRPGDVIAHGANGGGVIKIAVTDFLKLEGTIKADGFNSVYLDSSICGGGGGGGAIWISANEIEFGVTHELSAIGGQGLCGASISGGSGGGRNHFC